jgi:DNA repair protein RadC
MERTPQAEDRRLLSALLSPTIGADTDAAIDALLDHFDSLPAALATSDERLAQIVGPAALPLLHVARDLSLRLLRAEIEQRPLFDSPQSIAGYLHARLSYQAIEEIWVAYLDIGNRLIADEIVGRGTISEAKLYPREVLRRALEMGATSLILAHNHPSGDPMPSREDIAATRRLCRAALPLDIVVHDHIIVARSGWVSFRAQGLL